VNAPLVVVKHDALLTFIEAKSVHSNYWRSSRGSWGELLARLAAPQRTGETIAAYLALDKDAQGALKDAPGAWVGGALISQRGGRGRRNMAHRTLLTLDFDRVTDRAAFEVTARALGFALAWHSTRKHTPEASRFRLVVPLTGPIGLDEFDAVSRLVAERFGMDCVDPVSFVASQAMFFPSCSADSEFVFEAVDAPVLDAEAFLAPLDWRDATRLPRTPDEEARAFDPNARAGDPLSKPGVIGAFNRAYTITEAIERFIPEAYVQGTEGRLSYAAGETRNGAVLYENGTLLYSWHSTDPARGHCRSAFDLVRIHRFGHLDAAAHGNAKPTSLPSHAAMLDMLRQDEPTIAASIGVERRDAVDEFDAVDDGEGGADGSGDGGGGGTPPPSGAMPAGGAGAAGPRSWLRGLKFDANGAIITSLSNLVLILRHHPDSRDVFGFNEFAQRPCLRKLPGWARPSDKAPTADGRGVTDLDVVSMRVWLESTVGVRGVSQQLAFEALGEAAALAPYHPVRDYLAGRRWDGTPRAETFLIERLGAEDTPYVRAVTRKFLVGAVARVMEPGRQFDSILLLQGAQGLGKSRLVRALSNGWGAEGLPAFDSKDALEAMQGKWIVELSELVGFKRAEAERIKSFLTTCVDTYRRPYERASVSLPRQCVFIGTTNSAAPLRDSTGGRRFWIVECGKRPVDIAREFPADEVGQLWAEAVALYLDGESLWLDDAVLAAEAAAVQESYTVGGDELREAIEEWLAQPVPLDFYSRSPEERLEWVRRLAPRKPNEKLGLRNFVTVEDVWIEMQGGDSRLLTPTQREAITEALLRFPGWERGRVRVRGVQRRGIFNPSLPALAGVPR
jgi:putative DNA primase/helicase